MSKLISLNSLKNLDYEKIGLKCGLEIHQQLNTGKLFCKCPCEIVPNDTLDKSVERKLRFSMSETGDIDKAAMSEFKKGKYNIYKYNDKIACLVDLDEEPPGKLNQRALDTAVRVGQMMDIKFFDNFQFMRKLIIDGSVTAGFQRTCMLGLGGFIETSFGKVNINGINLEEDSSRTIERNSNHTIFALDRQGIPLIEITTGPQIKLPEQGFEVAKQLGNILRSFPETKRGLGTIRQDINVSIIGGARIEIKGAQNLKFIPNIIEAEVKRQLIHKSIIEELIERKVNADNFSDFQIYNVTEVFKNSTSKVILSNIKEKEGAVLALKLFSFKGILGHELHENYRFATEISNRNKKHFPEVKGLFHSDELPNYGITKEEVDNIRKLMKLKENDSFIIVANKKEVAENSLNWISQIISDLIWEVPSEVRQVDPKGTLTTFLRPMPGAARMYPETDVPTFEVTNNYLEEMQKQIPELSEKKISRISKDLNLEEGKVIEVLEKFSEQEIKNLLSVSKKSASVLYSIIFDIPKDIKKREKIEPLDFNYSLLEDLLKESEKNNFSQTVIRDIFLSLYKEKIESIENFSKYLEKKGFIGEAIGESEIEEKLKEIIEKNKGAPFGALMGHAMKEFGSKVDGKKISEMIKKLSN